MRECGKRLVEIIMIKTCIFQDSIPCYILTVSRQLLYVNKLIRQGFFLDSLFHNSQRAIANKVLLQTPNPDKLIIKVEVIEIKISL